MLLYADDLVITVRRMVEVQKALKILEDYCTTNGLEVSISKTKIVSFSKSGFQKKFR